MNKKWVFLLLGIFLMSFVSASNGYGFDLREGSEMAIEWIVGFSEPFLQVLLGGEDYTGLLLFERFLIFILLLSIIYLSLDNVPTFSDMPMVLWTVSIIVPLIAIRFMNFTWLNTIVFQYAVVGIAIAGLIPFIIYLFFLHNISQESMVRKIGWVFFILVYFGLWSTADSEIYGQIYFWTIVAALAALVLDRAISRLIEQRKWKESGKSAIWDAIVKKDKELRDLRADTSIPHHSKKRQMQKKEREIRGLYKRMHKL